MSARHLSTAMAITLALAAIPAAAESAKPRGGSSDDRSVGSRHHSSGSERSTPSAVSRGSGSGASSFTDAQSRHPRAGSGHASRHGRSYYYPRHRFYGYGYGYGGFPYFDYYYGPWGYRPYYAPFGGYYGYSRYRGDYGSVRVLVDPSETEVLVDGSYAGTVDEFDGLFQRLHVSPGRHELTLKLDGYRTHRMRVYVPYDGTLKIHHDMVRGEGDESFEDLAGDRGDEDERAALDDDRGERPRYDDPPGDDDRPRRRGFEERRAARGPSGTLQLDVQPDEASIYVDGVFRGTGRSLRRLELAAGTHRVEILHPGMRTFEQDVTIDEDESEALEVELTR